jgi:membrane-bound ClpP family serine protease
MKLLIAGLALIAAGLGLVLFTYLSPAVLFIAGAVCTFLGVINLLSVSYGLGAGVSSDATDAIDLYMANNRGPAGGSAQGFNDHI